MKIREKARCDEGNSYMHQRSVAFRLPKSTPKIPRNFRPDSSLVASPTPERGTTYTLVGRAADSSGTCRSVTGLRGLRMRTTNRCPPRANGGYAGHSARTAGHPGETAGYVGEAPDGKRGRHDICTALHPFVNRCAPRTSDFT